MAQVFGPDAKGIKTIIEHKVREDGAKVRHRLSPTPSPAPTSRACACTRADSQQFGGLRGVRSD